MTIGFGTADALPEDAAAIRRAVFVEEQGFRAEEEFDANDAVARHIVLVEPRASQYVHIPYGRYGRGLRVSPDLTSGRGSGIAAMPRNVEDGGRMHPLDIVGRYAVHYHIYYFSRGRLRCGTGKKRRQNNKQEPFHRAVIGV